MPPFSVVRVMCFRGHLDGQDIRVAPQAVTLCLHFSAFSIVKNSVAVALKKDSPIWISIVYFEINRVGCKIKIRTKSVKIENNFLKVQTISIQSSLTWTARF